METQREPHFEIKVFPYAYLGVLFAILFWAFQLTDFMAYDGFSHNDCSAHTRYVQSVIQMFERGDFNLDYWQSGMSTGSPVFRVYQNWPHLMAGFFAYHFGWSASHAVHFFAGFFWLLQFPCCYLAARWMGMGVAESLVVVWVAPLIRAQLEFGHELRSYVPFGFGLFTQSVAFPAFVLFWGASIRFLGFGAEAKAPTRKTAFAMGVGLGTLFLLHEFLGCIGGCFFALGLVASFFTRKLKFGPELLKRLLLMGIGFVLVSGYQLLSVVKDVSLRHSVVIGIADERVNGLGLGKAFAVLFKGGFFDGPRLPAFSALVLLGLVLAFKQHWRLRFLLVVPFFLSVVLMSGRNGFGQAFDRIALLNLIASQRYLIVAHLCGIFIAAHAIYICLKLFLVTPAPRATVWTSLCGLILLPVAYLYVDCFGYLGLNHRFIREQNQANVAPPTKIIRYIKEHRKGNLWHPNGGPAGPPPALGTIRYDMVLSELGIPTMTFSTDQISYGSDVPLLLTDAEHPDAFGIFNIQFVLLGKTGVRFPFLHEVVKEQDLTLYEMNSPGDWDVIRVPKVVLTENSKEWYTLVQEWMESKDPAKHLYPAFVPKSAAKDYPDGIAPIPNLAFLDAPLGKVVNQTLIENGKSEATLFATDAHQYGMLRVGYHPRWKIVRNGVRVSPLWVGPGFFAFPLVSGPNAVSVTFEKDPVRQILFLISLVTVLATCLIACTRSVIFYRNK